MRTEEDLPEHYQELEANLRQCKAAVEAYIDELARQHGGDFAESLFYWRERLGAQIDQLDCDRKHFESRAALAPAA